MEASGRREAFRGNLIRVEVADWPQGAREIVRHPGVCAIVAVTAEREIVLVRQLRESIEQSTLEIPAGLRDLDGEDPADCAARELLEETGFRAVEVRPLGVFYSSPGFTDEQFQLFRAEAEPTPAPSEEGIEVVTLPVPEAVDAIRSGVIVDSMTALAILLAEPSLGLSA